MNEIENAAITASLTVLTIEESSLLRTLTSNKGLIWSLIAAMIEKESSSRANVCFMKCSNDMSGSWNELMICGMSRAENSLIFWKTIGTKRANIPTITIQMVNSVHNAASHLGKGILVRPMWIRHSMSVIGFPIMANTAEVRI